MNRTSRVWASKVVILGVVAAAWSCGGTTGGTGGGSGTNSSGSCALAAGTYTIQYTLQAGASANCPTIPDEMTTLAADENLQDIMTATTTTMASDGGLNCTSNETGCSLSETCSESSDGANIQLTLMLTAGNNSLSGQVDETIDDPAASVSLSCNYAVTYTQ